MKIKSYSYGSYAKIQGAEISLVKRVVFLVNYSPLNRSWSFVITH